MIHPDVNPLKTISNDIYEVYDCLGLEAARQVLSQRNIRCIYFCRLICKFRHVNLLVDIITNRGFLMSIDRHGINKSDRGPLAKRSFEETPDIIARAAIFGELDKVTSVSSNIMLGQEVPIGTGAVDVMFDEEKYFENIQIVHEELVQEEEEEKPMKNKNLKKLIVITYSKMHIIIINNFNIFYIKTIIL